MSQPGRRPWDDGCIVVVSGLPRSGTSLMMQILERAGWPVLCDGRRPADASNPRGYYEFAPVRSSLRDASWVTQARGHAVKVIHALLPGLPPEPRYRVLLMQRAMEEVLASQEAMLERLGQPASVPRERLGSLFARQLQQTRRLLDERRCFEWIEVDHGRLIRTPEIEIRRVAAFLELDLDGGHDRARDRDRARAGAGAGDATLAALAACVEPGLHRERLAAVPSQDPLADGGKASRI